MMRTFVSVSWVNASRPLGGRYSVNGRFSPGMKAILRAAHLDALFTPENTVHQLYGPSSATSWLSTARQRPGEGAREARPSSVCMLEQSQLSCTNFGALQWLLRTHHFRR